MSVDAVYELYRRTGGKPSLVKVGDAKTLEGVQLFRKRTQRKHPGWGELGIYDRRHMRWVELPRGWFSEALR